MAQNFQINSSLAKPIEFCHTNFKTLQHQIKGCKKFKFVFIYFYLLLLLFFVFKFVTSIYILLCIRSKRLVVCGRYTVSVQVLPPLPR